jgi:arsenate reductase (thioredoxin)
MLSSLRSTRCNAGRRKPRPSMRFTIANVLLILIAVVGSACSTTAVRDERKAAQVLFVCEHGNVKSLMATLYFNELARKRDLGFRAQSLGSAPDSTSVPDAIASGLRDDGFDVGAFTPVRVASTDIAAAGHIVLIGTELPADTRDSAIDTERWDDVPAASVNFEAARDSLKSHVARLIDQLSSAAER